MSAPGSLTWFAQHESRLAWRDLMSMMTAGKREREKKVAGGVLIFVAVMHVIAYFAVGGVGAGIVPDVPTLIAVSTGIALSASAMLSQAMESVTRTFYTRSDLELILSSPVEAERLFAVRIGAIAVSVGAMSLLFIGPFVDVLAWRSGAQWLLAYGLIFAASLCATALAVVLTAALFQTIGPRRTRTIAQIAAAIIGGLFVIGLQMAALFSTGTMSRFAFLRSDYVAAHAPPLNSVLWWPARAALGDFSALASVLSVSFALFLLATIVYAPRFAGFALAASSVSHRGRQTMRTGWRFRVGAPAAALRTKERLLLVRDPWLMSQSLMQILYLLPPAVLLWQGYANGGNGAMVLAPVLVMAAGQLAGGLAWLTISGEDAPDLVMTAPVSPGLLLRAKIEAVMQSIAIVFLPFVGALLFLSPTLALVVVAGVSAAAASATAIQLWFRAQAKRSLFRRRHTSSRIATFSEALSSITWAATAAIAAAGSWLAIIVGAMALGILGAVWLVSPARAAR
ncbi:MAG: permease [Alphaproteobacteria bacterium]|nr:permease [Alphaproteobacteria bacterium]